MFFKYIYIYIYMHVPRHVMIKKQAMRLAKQTLHDEDFRERVGYTVRVAEK